VALRRWQKALDAHEDEMQMGPQETALRAELKEMGWDVEKPGHLATVAESCIALAEAIDRSVSARDIAACTNELSRRMAEARTSNGKGAKLSVVEQAQGRVNRRGPGTTGPRRSAG
jgi:hypothetical protein